MKLQMWGRQLHALLPYILLIVAEYLEPSDLSDILNAIFTAGDKWFQIGLQLRLSYSTLNVIKRDNHDTTDCLTDMLQKWLTSTSSPPTWSGLVQALSSGPVGEKRLAEEIRKQYCQQDEEHATGPASGEGRTVCT